MAKIYNLKLFVILTVLVVFCFSIPMLSCDRNDDGDDFAEFVNRDNGGSGSSSANYDDDDSNVDDDDDDNDDSVDDDDDDDTAGEINVLVFHGEDAVGQNDSFRSFLVGYGFSPTFREDSDASSVDFSKYAVIIATETCEFYSSADSQAIKDSGKKVLGIYEGGAILFRELGLWMDFGSADYFDVQDITAFHTDLSLWSDPYSVSIDSLGDVSISSVNLWGLALSSAVLPNNIVELGRIADESYRMTVGYEDSRYMFWGIEFDPGNYTANARMLLANLIYYLCD